MVDGLDMAIFQHRHGTTTEWAVSTRILLEGEIGFDTTSGHFRMGNGRDVWVNLPDYTPTQEMIWIIQQSVDDAFANSGGGAEARQALDDHINSDSPHPVYDDGPSLKLLYLNAKV